jgi:hypothetical protein
MYDDRVFHHCPARSSVERYGDGYRGNRFWLEQRVGYR